MKAIVTFDSGPLDGELFSKLIQQWSGQYFPVYGTEEPQIRCESIAFTKVDGDGYPLLGPYFEAQGYAVKWDCWKRWTDEGSGKGYRMYSIRMCGPIPPWFLQPGQDRFTIDVTKPFMTVVPETAVDDQPQEGTPTTYNFTTHAIYCSAEKLDAMIRFLLYTPATMLLMKKAEGDRAFFFDYMIDWSEPEPTSARVAG